jgi:transposase
MDKDTFTTYLERVAERGKAFADYRDEILEIYRNHPDRPVYSAGIYDYLAEKHGELPGTERTLRNYLTSLKASGAVPQEKGQEYKPVAVLPYGKQAQIDFGQERTTLGVAYFVVVILARSRYRYVAAQDRPFTTVDVIGHLMDAFEYFGGVPEEVVLDQDRTMLVAENLRDLVMTKGFTDFVAEQGFRLHACRAADPESKGKVENLVKYVKPNFFSSRSFSDFDHLKSAMRRWLGRANARISQATRLMPLADFEAHEKPSLRAVRPSIFRPSEGSESRKPRMVDHTSLISVGGTKYSVPSDYRLSTVEIEVRGDRIRIFDPKTGIEIAAHTIVQGAAAPVVDDAHYTNRTAATEALRDELLARNPEDAAWRSFVEGMWQTYRRYFREHATRLVKLFATSPDREKLRQALARCQDLGLHSAQDLLDAYVAGGGVIGIQGRKPAREPSSSPRARPPAVDRRSLDVYKDFLVDVAKRTGGQA